MLDGRGAASPSATPPRPTRSSTRSARWAGCAGRSTSSPRPPLERRPAGRPRRAPSVLFLGVVDRVLRDLDRHVLLRQDRLAATGATSAPGPRRGRAGLPRFSSGSPSESKPSRTTTWQVVQAQLISQACSIVDAVLEQRLADRRARLAPRSSRAFGAVLGVRQDLDDRAWSEVLDAAARRARAGCRGPCAARRRPRCRRPAPRPPRSMARRSSPAARCAQRGDQRVDRRALVGVEQVAVGGERATRRQRACARPRPAPRAARAPRMSSSACAKPSLQHARDLVVGQAVGRLDRRPTASTPDGLLARRHARAARRHRPGR